MSSHVLAPGFADYIDCQIAVSKLFKAVSGVFQRVILLTHDRAGFHPHHLRIQSRKIMIFQLKSMKCSASPEQSGFEQLTKMIREQVYEWGS
jgi:hypothetical protein